MGGIPFFPETASTIAGRIDALFFYMLLLTIFFSGLIATLLTVFSIKYRRRSETEIPRQISGSTRLEIGWTVPLFALALIAFFWGAWLYIDLYRPPADSLEIYVIGKQWMWKYQHPDGQQEIADLHVPVGRPVKLTMTSQDVIHSFFIPAFRVKSDVVPGRYTTLWFEATEIGEYHIFCTEYCGTSHSRMDGTVYVMSEADYQEWLTTGNTTRAPMGSPADQGEQLFGQLGCAGCHRMEGNGPGPSLAGVYGEPVQLADGSEVLADETYIRDSILNPNAQIVAGYEPQMPTYEGQVTEEQLLLLIDYIKSLSNDAVEPVQ